MIILEVGFYKNISNSITNLLAAHDKYNVNNSLVCVASLMGLVEHLDRPVLALAIVVALSNG